MGEIKNGKLDFGLLLAFRNPPTWRRPWDEIYEEHINQAKVAEDLGYDTVRLTEHHFWRGWLVPCFTTYRCRNNCKNQDN